MWNIQVSKSVVAMSVVCSLMMGGCATMPRHPDIPATALMTTEGTGRLAYNPVESGEVFVYDVTDEELIYSGRVRTNEIVIVDPDEKHITVDQRLVAEEALNPGNTHRIFFEPGSSLF